MSEDPSKRNYVNNTPYPLNNNQFNPAQSQNQNQQNNEPQQFENNPSFNPSYIQNSRNVNNNNMNNPSNQRSIHPFPSAAKNYNYSLNSNNFGIHPTMTRTDPFTLQRMQFANRSGRIRIEEISNLNFNTIIKTNNVMSLEKFAENLIYADPDEFEFNDPNMSRLIKQFQYSLEYLNNKQNEYDNANNILENNYNQLINDSYILEERLKKNKRLIAKYKSSIKEKEMLLHTYRSIIDFNVNPTEEENLIIKNYESTKEKLQNKNGFYMCHICSGKPFSSEEKLESHMKRRHLHQANFLNDDLNESYDNYNKKINEMKSYFEDIIKKNNEDNLKNDYFKGLNMMKLENERKMKEMENHLKDVLEGFKDYIIRSSLMAQQNATIIQAKQIPEKKEEEEKKLQPDPTAEEIKKMTQSIMDLNNLLKEQYNNNNKIDEMKKEMENIKNQQNKLQLEQNNLKKYPQQNQTKINVNLNDQRNPSEKKIFVPLVNKEEEDKKSEAKSQFENEIEKSIEINPNEIKNDVKSEDDSQKIGKLEQVLRNKKKKTIQNNIIEEEIIVTNKLQNKDNNEEEEDKKEENEIDNKSKENLHDSNNFKNSQENFEINTNVNNKIINSPPKEMSKTTKLKTKKKFQPIEIKMDYNKTMTKADELDLFYAKFMNRDNAILEEEEPKVEDYMEKIIPNEIQQDENKLMNTLNMSINNKAKEENIPLDDYMDKNKVELLDIIDKTLKNIEEINEKNEINELYYDSVRKAIDLKLLEADKESMKNSIDPRTGLLKKTRSNKASKIISEANNFNQSEFE